MKEMESTSISFSDGVYCAPSCHKTLSWHKNDRYAMASSKLSIFLFLPLHFLFFLSSSVNCSGHGSGRSGHGRSGRSSRGKAPNKEDNLILQLNNYRVSLGLERLAEKRKADCLAAKISSELAAKPCSSANDYLIKPGNGPQFPSYEELLNKCHIDNNTTTDGIILPVCVHKLRPAAVVLNHYTHTHFSQFVNDPKYTVAGFWSDHDWVVVVLSTGSQSGSFSGAADLVAFGMVHYFLVFLLHGIVLIIWS